MSFKLSVNVLVSICLTSCATIPVNNDRTIATDALSSISKEELAKELAAQEQLNHRLEAVLSQKDENQSVKLSMLLGGLFATPLAVTNAAIALKIYNKKAQEQAKTLGLNEAVNKINTILESSKLIDELEVLKNADLAKLKDQNYTSEAIKYAEEEMMKKSKYIKRDSPAFSKILRQYYNEKSAKLGSLEGINLAKEKLGYAKIHLEANQNRIRTHDKAFKTFSVLTLFSTLLATAMLSLAVKSIGDLELNEVEIVKLREDLNSNLLKIENLKKLNQI